MKPERPWTFDESAKLLDLYKTNSYAEIGVLLGRSTASVRNRRYKMNLGLKTGRWTPGEIETLRAAYAGGAIKINDLAARLGRLKSNVCRKARELGLTRRERPHHHPAGAISARVKGWHAHNEHPLGALGMKHTDAARMAISSRAIASWADPASAHNSEANRQRISNMAHIRMLVRPVTYSRGAGGRRPDLGDAYFRSSWEANYARYLNLLMAQGAISGWEFEPKTFVFEAVKRGTRSYCPDFLVTFQDGRKEWHEVKGWMDAKSKTKLARMARYFPEEKIVIIGKDWFASANATIAHVLPHWEHKGRCRWPQDASGVPVVQKRTKTRQRGAEGQRGPSRQDGDGRRGGALP